MSANAFKVVYGVPFKIRYTLQSFYMNNTGQALSCMFVVVIPVQVDDCGLFCSTVHCFSEKFSTSLRNVLQELPHIPSW